MAKARSPGTVIGDLSELVAKVRGNDYLDSMTLEYNRERRHYRLGLPGQEVKEVLRRDIDAFEQELLSEAGTSDDPLALLATGLSQERNGALLVGKAIYLHDQNPDADADQLKNALLTHYGMELPSAPTLTKRKKVYENWVVRAGVPMERLIKARQTKLYQAGQVADEAKAQGRLDELLDDVYQLTEEELTKKWLKESSKVDVTVWHNYRLPEGVHELVQKAKGAWERALLAEHGDYTMTDQQFQEFAAALIERMAEQMPGVLLDVFNALSGHDPEQPEPDNDSSEDYDVWYANLERLAQANDLDLSGGAAYYKLQYEAGIPSYQVVYDLLEDEAAHRAAQEEGA